MASPAASPVATPTTAAVEGTKSKMGDGTRRLVLLAGLPGTGKGTAKEHFEKTHDAVTLSMGDVLRAYIADDVLPSLTERIVAGMKARLVDPDVVHAVLAHACATLPKSARLVVLDGIPRTEADAEMAARDLAPLFHRTHFVVLSAPDDVLVRRCISRGRDDSSTEADVRERIAIERKAFEGVTTGGKLAEWQVNIDADCSTEEILARIDTALGM